MKWQSLIVLIYALFVLVGGIIGFMKAHSHVSLIMGTTSGLLLMVAAFGIYHSYNWGLFLGFILTALLMFFFGYRFFLNQAFFPSGLMTMLSVVTLFFLALLPRR